MSLASFRAIFACHVGFTSPGEIPRGLLRAFAVWISGSLPPISPTLELLYLTV
jgi:hypothetical protein